MDPKANLNEQLKLARTILALADAPENVIAQERIAREAERLAELVLALNEWMEKGGFSPWTPKPDWEGMISQRRK